MVLIHRFDVLGVDLHCHKISSPNSSYFSRNQRFSLPISAQIDEQLAQNFSKKSEPEKAGPPAKAGPIPGRSTPLRLARSAASTSPRFHQDTCASHAATSLRRACGSSSRSPRPPRIAPLILGARLHSKLCIAPAQASASRHQRSTPPHCSPH
jgi:hypothetical protein